MSENPYESPKEAGQPSNRSHVERAMAAIAAALIGCCCGAATFFLISGYSLSALGGFGFFGKLLDFRDPIAMAIGLLITVGAGGFLYRFFMRDRPTMPTSQAPAQTRPSRES